MPNPLQQAGALSEPSSFAPLHTNRIVTGLWTNRNLLRDAATSDYQEKYGLGRQESILDGKNAEITPHLTLRRRKGNKVFNTQSFAPINRFYSFNTFTLTDEIIHVMVDTAATVYDGTSSTASPNTKNPIFTKSAGAGSTYFLGVGNTLYFTNGIDNKQWHYDPTTGTGTVYDWGVIAPTTAPVVTQQPRPNSYNRWAADTVYGFNTSSRSGIVILDDVSGTSGIPFANIPPYRRGKPFDRMRPEPPRRRSSPPPPRLRQHPHRGMVYPLQRIPVFGTEWRLPKLKLRRQRLQRVPEPIRRKRWICDEQLDCRRLGCRRDFACRHHIGRIYHHRIQDRQRGRWSHRRRRGASRYKHPRPQRVRSGTDALPLRHGGVRQRKPRNAGGNCL